MLFCSVIAVDVLVRSMRKPAPDFPYRCDHYIETTNFFLGGEFGGAVPDYSKVWRSSEKVHFEISVLDETVLLQYGALGFAWLSKVS